MLFPSTSARLCAALLVTCISSTAIAEFTAVSDRASLGATDIIDWGAADGYLDVSFVYSPASVLTQGGATVTVAQSGAPYSYIFANPGAWGYTIMPNGMHAYSTEVNDVFVNPISFTDFDGIEVCALGTQVQPLDPGTYTARIEAFGDTGSLQFYEFTGSTGNPEALFAGIESSEPMTRVEVSIVDTGGVMNSFYAINQIDLRACESGPEIPVVSCQGFAAPMNQYPVKTKKNRVFPLKMELFDADGFELTGADLAAPPVVTVMFSSSGGAEGTDVSSDALAAGMGTEGNQFEYTDDGIWQFNLKSKDYHANGTYLVTVVSGDESEYVIDPACETSFVK